MATKKNPGRISMFLKSADKAIEDGIKKADEMLDEAVEFGHMTYDDAKKTHDEVRQRVVQNNTTAKKVKKPAKTVKKAAKKTAKKIDGK